MYKSRQFTGIPESLLNSKLYGNNENLKEKNQSGQSRKVRFFKWG